MDMPIELDIDDDLGAALGDAPEKDLVDLAGQFVFFFRLPRRYSQSHPSVPLFAGILGMHSMLSQAQYYNALKGKPQDELSGTSFTGTSQLQYRWSWNSFGWFVWKLDVI